MPQQAGISNILHICTVIRGGHRAEGRRPCALRDLRPRGTRASPGSLAPPHLWQCILVKGVCSDESQAILTQQYLPFLASFFFLELLNPKHIALLWNSLVCCRRTLKRCIYIHGSWHLRVPLNSRLWTPTFRCASRSSTIDP